MIKKRTYKAKEANVVKLNKFYEEFDKKDVEFRYKPKNK